MRGVVLAEGAQAAPVVVVMDLVVEVLDVVAEGSKTQQNGATVLSKELSRKLQVTLRQLSQMH